MFLFEDATIAFFAISFTAIIYSVLSRQIQNRLGDRKRVKQIQDEVNAINKRVKEAMASGDERKQKESEAEQEKLSELLKESMMLQFKPLIVSLPIFFGVSWALRQLFPSFTLKLAFAIPVFIQNLERFPNWRDTFGPVGWFVLALLIAGLGVSAIVDRLEKMRKK